MHRQTILAGVVATLLALLLLWWFNAPTDAPLVPDVTATGTTMTADPVQTAQQGTPAVQANPTTNRDVAERTVVDGGPAVESAALTGYRGRVVTARGEPVPAILVRLFRGSPDIVLQQRFDPFMTQPVDVPLEAGRAVTDDLGRFLLQGVLARGLCWVRLDWPDPKQAPVAWANGHGTVIPVQAAPVPGEVSDLGDLVLQIGGSITGRIVDEDGAPLPGALVRAGVLPPIPPGVFPLDRIETSTHVIATISGIAPVLQMPNWLWRVVEALPIARSTSDADGRFELHGVSVGSATFVASAKEHTGVVRQGIAVTSGAKLHLGDIELGSGELAEVQVVDTAGNPVANAEVVVASVLPVVPVHLGALAPPTDEEGRTELSGLPRGPAVAAARRDAKGSWTVGESSPIGSTLRVALAARHTLTLAVVGPDDLPVEGLQLRLYRGAAGVIEAAMVGFGQPLPLNGRTRELEDGSVQISDLEAGAWRVLAAAPGFAARTEDFELAADSKHTVRLQQARTLETLVLDGEGQPVEGAEILVQARGGERSQRIVDWGIGAGRTDAEGRLLIRSLPTGEARVTANHPLHGQAHQKVAEPLPAQLVLAFERACTITGTLTDGGRAPDPGRWILVLERRFDERRPRGALPDMPQLALPDLQGRFRFGALQPGRYRVTAQDSVTDISTMGGLFEYMQRQRQMHPWNRAEVDLEPGEQRDVELDALIDQDDYNGPGAYVRGSVTVNGAPATGALVIGTTPETNRRTLCRVDQSGTFDLGLCPEGKLRLVVVPRDVVESRLRENLFSHHFARDLELTNGQSIDLPIDLRTGSVRGTVVDWNGNPVATARVSLRLDTKEQSVQRMATTDAQGEYRIAQIPAGVYTATVSKAGFGRAGPTSTTVQEGIEVLAAPLQLQAVVTLQGEVVIDPLPESDFEVILVGTTTGDERTTRTRRRRFFRFLNLDPGSYQAFVQLSGRRVPCGEVTATPSDSRSVKLTPLR
jgi:protocatechuate 3,4-dioxygenase beta subunit